MHPTGSVCQNLSAVFDYHLALIDALVDSRGASAVSRGVKADLTYINFIEQQIRRTPTQTFSLALTGPGNREPVQSTHIFKLMWDVSNCIRRMHQVSIHDAVEECILARFTPSLQLEDANSDLQRRQNLIRAVSVTCSWITMLFRPNLSLQAASTSPGSLDVDGEGQKPTSQPSSLWRVNTTHRRLSNFTPEHYHNWQIHTIS